MYPKIEFPKKVTEKWLNRAFAPLRDYLGRDYPEEARFIMPYMTFLCNEDQRFYYRNCVTKGSIVFDQTGRLVSCGKEALRYTFAQREEAKADRPPREERFIHPNVIRWTEKRLGKQTNAKFGEEICIFLQEFWGPIVNYDFDDLKAGYPPRGARSRYCLYMYPSEFPRLVAIRFVGDEIVEKRCSYAQYRKFEKQERDLIVEGWHVITIIREVLDRDLNHFRLYLAKAIELAAPRDPIYVLTEAGRRETEKD